MASRIVVKYQGKTYIGKVQEESVANVADKLTIQLANKPPSSRIVLYDDNVLVLGYEATLRAAFIVQGVNDEPNGRVVSEKETLKEGGVA